MPIENERKYVLGNIGVLLANLESGGEHGPGYWGRGSIVEQGYLPGGARIRRRHVGENQGLYAEFNYKIKAGDDLVEIETMIEAADFDRLWPLTSKRVRKMRFATYWEKDKWDVDFLLGADDKVYFAMAECEMAPGQLEPASILPPLVPHIVYLVPLDRQLEFTNKRLSDPDYARSLTW